MEGRPNCRCHGEPMLKDGHMRGKQKWQCGIQERARQARLWENPAHRERKLAEMRERWNAYRSEQARDIYRERQARGLCTRCKGKRLSEAFCWDCLNEMEARRAVRV